jgi:putative transposase
MPRRKEPKIPDAILDQLLPGADAKTVFDPNGLLDELKKATAATAMARRPSSPTPASSNWRCRGTGRRAEITHPLVSGVNA